MKNVLLLHLVTFVTFIPHSQMHHLVFPIFPQMGDQIKKAVILNKMTNISGFEHCCKKMIVIYVQLLYILMWKIFRTFQKSSLFWTKLEQLQLQLNSCFGFHPLLVDISVSLAAKCVVWAGSAHWVSSASFLAETTNCWGQKLHCKQCKQWTELHKDEGDWRLQKYFFVLSSLSHCYIIFTLSFHVIMKKYCFKHMIRDTPTLQCFFHIN